MTGQGWVRRRSARRGLSVGLGLVAVVGVLVYYAWAVSPGRPVFAGDDSPDAYYNLLVRGFRGGRLSLDLPVNPALLALPDPYDPRQNAPYRVLDTSLYRGRYYLYFGVVPAVVLYGPFNLLTGRYLGDPQAGFIFCAVGFLAGTALLGAVRRRYFPGLGSVGWFAGVLAWGGLTLVPLLLRRMAIWEVAIAAGFAFSVLAAWALFHAFHSRRSTLWLVGASLAYGLAIGARPTYAFGAIALLGPVLWGWRAAVRARGETAPARWPAALAAVGPVTLIVAALLGYNALRFGNPLEFGERYQLSGVYESHLRHFSPSYVGYNLRAYFLAPAQWSPYFPFVRVVGLPTPPPGHQGVEDPYGLLTNVPFVWLALALPGAARRQPPMAAFLLSVGAGGLAVGAVVALFGLASNRYMVDFTPALILGSIIGFWQLLGAATGRWRIGLTVAATGAWTYSLVFVFFAAVTHNELLRQNDPMVYRRLAHAFGYPRYYWDRLIGRTYGPLELTVQLPQPGPATPRLQPLVIAGSEFLSDYLYLFYPSADYLVVAFEHTSHGGPGSKAIPIDYGRVHRFRIELAGLYPPAGDPYFDGLSPAEVARRTAHLGVGLDDLPLFDAPQEFYPPVRIRPAIGEAAEGQGALGRKFTGRILQQRILDPAAGAAPDPGWGGILLAVEYPAGRTSGHEPLVQTGVPGRADLLVVNYLGPRRVSFTVDHWGNGGPTSDPVDVDPNVRQTIVVRFGSFFPPAARPAGVAADRWNEAAARLEVIVNGRELFDAPMHFYPAAASTLALGRNEVGASTCSSQFTGRILGWHREDPWSDQPERSSIATGVMRGSN
jgi:hypothetical protein